MGRTAAAINHPTVTPVCLTPIAMALSFAGNHSITPLLVEGGILLYATPKSIRKIKISMNVFNWEVRISRKPIRTVPNSSMRRTPNLSVKLPEGIDRAAMPMYMAEMNNPI